MRRMNPRAFALMCKLADGSRTCEDLSEECGLSRLTIYHYMTALHKQKLVHIAGWGEDKLGRHSVFLYRFGPGIDAKRQPVQRKEICRQWRERRRQQAFQNALAGKGEQSNPIPPLRRQPRRQQPDSSITKD